MMIGRLQKYIPESLRRNYKVKLFSVVSALFIWFYVVTDNYFEVTIPVPLQLVNFPEGYILANEIPSTVKVLFRGSGKSLLSFYYRDKSIELDLYQMRQSAIFRLGIGMINGMSPGVNIAPLRIVEPDSVLVKLDQYAVRQVPVLANIELDVIDGYTQVGNLHLEPDSVQIQGPKAVVDKIDFIETESKSCKKLARFVEGRVDLLPPESKMVQFKTSQVRYAADIQRIGERYISGIPVQVLHTPKGAHVSVVPSTLSLKLQGGVSLLAELKKEDITASIDYNSRYRYHGRGIPANIKLPNEITFSDVHPKFFELRVGR